jgi:hypothetical protein
MSKRSDCIKAIRNQAYEFAKKAQFIFATNNWTWILPDGSGFANKVPTADQICFHVFDLCRDLDRAFYCNCESISAGLIEVSVRQDSNGEYYGAILLVAAEVRGIVPELDDCNCGAINVRDCMCHDPLLDALEG